MDHSSGFLKLVEDAKMRIKETTVEEVYQRMQSGEKICLMDCREESEWARGHIKGAAYLGRGIFERDIEKLYPDKSAELIIYCGGGFRSALVCDNLMKMGYTKVISMDGGWRDWNARQYPIEK